ncbi:MAG TPA: biotin--[acetyl-CoA-carboxylase] ligase [Longilinea sp.]|nr:biotin--[acetyl-CoA-carboxylase] ligase [Longilinea sp.]
MPRLFCFLRRSQGIRAQNCGTIIFMDYPADETALRVQLQGLPLSEVRFSAETGSTNDDAQRWLDAGAPDGALVVADRQTTGRGRFNRRWITQAGAGLACSLILRPNFEEMDHLSMLSPLAGLAVSDGLASCCGLHPEIKWPNDVLLLRRKVCGVLVETSWLADRLAGVVIGIGVNVAPSSVPPAETLLFPAISVEEVTGHPVNRWELLAAILKAAFSWRNKIATPEFFQSWEKRLAFKGEIVQVETPGGMLEGTLTGIDSQGGLVLQLIAGKQEVITVGDVHLRPADKS